MGTLSKGRHGKRTQSRGGCEQEHLRKSSGGLNKSVKEPATGRGLEQGRMRKGMTKRNQKSPGELNKTGPGACPTATNNIPGQKWKKVQKKQNRKNTEAHIRTRSGGGGGGGVIEKEPLNTREKRGTGEEKAEVIGEGRQSPPKRKKR